MRRFPITLKLDVFSQRIAAYLNGSAMISPRKPAVGCTPAWTFASVAEARGAIHEKFGDDQEIIVALTTNPATDTNRSPDA